MSPTSTRSRSPSQQARRRCSDRRVAKEITLFGQASRYAEPALVNGTNGTVGILVAPRGRLHLVLSLTIDAETDLITAYELIADPIRRSRLDLAVLPSSDLQ